VDPVVLLALLCVAFVGSHFLLSHRPVREALIARVGAGRFRGLYSLLSIALFVPLAWTWWHHRHAGAALWVVRTPAVVHAMEVVAALGLAMVVAGFVQPAPSSMEARVKGDRFEVRGLAHVTRHPVMWGTALLCLAHLPTNGWVSDLWFWGSNLALALVGAALQDHRLVRTRPGYGDFVARTTFLPNPLGLARIGRRSLVAGAIGAAVAVGVRLVHGSF
jgi:uncharacterized membrane protein